MNNKPSLKYEHLIQEQIYLEQLEQQLISGYLTEKRIIEMLKESDMSHTELNLIDYYKPGYLVSLLEANPVGLGSRIGTWAKSKVPLQNFQASAQGQQQYNQQANNLKKQLHRYLGSINKKVNTLTNNEFLGFLQNQRVDVVNNPKLAALANNPNNILGDQQINQSILDAVSFANTSQTNVPQQQASPTNPPPQPQPQPPQLPPAQVNKMASVLNNLMRTNQWDWAKTTGFIKQLKAAGINIS